MTAKKRARLINPHLQVLDFKGIYFLLFQIPLVDVIGQDQLGPVVLPQTHVEYMRGIVTMMRNVMAISYVATIIVWHHCHGMLNAAMTQSQVSKYFVLWITASMQVCGRCTRVSPMNHFAFFGSNYHF